MPREKIFKWYLRFVETSRVWHWASPVKVKWIYPGGLCIDFLPPTFGCVNKSLSGLNSLPVWVLFSPAFWKDQAAKLLTAEAQISCSVPSAIIEGSDVQYVCNTQDVSASSGTCSGYLCLMRVPLNILQLLMRNAATLRRALERAPS